MLGIVCVPVPAFISGGLQTEIDEIKIPREREREKATETERERMSQKRESSRERV